MPRARRRTCPVSPIRFRPRFSVERLEDRRLLSTASLVEDINPLVGACDPDFLVNIEGTLYLAAENNFERELWAYDGTTATKIDINPQGSSDPVYLCNVAGTLYFSAHDGTDRELWKYDGQEAVKFDLNPAGDSNPGELTAIGDTLFVSAVDGGNSRLWKVDSAGASIVEPLRISSPNYLTVVDGILYCSANDGSGAELWKYESGNATKIDINPTGGSNPRYLVESAGSVFFQASDGSDVELWMYDGTTPTKLDINPSGDSTPYRLTDAAGILYLSASDGNDRGLWKYDGELSKVDLNPTGASNPNGFGAVGATLYVYATDGNGYGLWRLDGATATRLDIVAVGSPAFRGAVGTTAYYSLNDTTGSELWMIDGTTAEKVDLNPQGDSYPDDVVDVGGVLYVSAEGPVGRGLWKHDGGTWEEVPINPAAGSNPKSLAGLDGTVYFRADDGEDIELWSSDGQTTTKIDLNPSGDSKADYLVRLGPYLYFSAYDGTSTSLWRHDGENVEKIEIAGVTRPRHLTVVDTDLYFVDYTGPSSTLWKFDGSTATQMTGFPPLTVPEAELTAANGMLFFQTVRWSGSPFDIELGWCDGTSVTVVDLHPSTASLPSGFTAVGTDVYFRAFGEVGHELWQHDGSNVRPVAVNRTGGSNPTSLTEFGGELYFAADGGDDVELWRCVARTATEIDINPAGDSDPAHLAVVGNVLFFAASDETDRELWSYDGTTATKIDVNPAGSSNPENLTAAAGRLFFTASDGTQINLWSYDGSTLKKIENTPPGLSDPADITNVSGTLFFSAYHPESGRELWLHYASQGEIHGAKWSDWNADGNWDANEPALPNWTFYLDLNENGQFDEDDEPTAVTDLAGRYAFKDLAAGEYVVVEQIPAGWQHTSEFDDQPGRRRVSLSFRQVVGDFDFGNFRPNHLPTNVGLTNSTVLEHEPVGTLVGVLSTSDADAGEVHTYALVAGNGDADNALFEIDGDQLKTAAIPNYADGPTRTVRVRTTDPVGATYETTLTIDVTDTNAAPTDIELSPREIEIYRPVGSAVGELATTDLDREDRHTYQLVAGTGDTGNSLFYMDGSTVRATVSFDVESSPTYLIRVRSTDLGGVTIEESFTISVIGIPPQNYDFGDAPASYGTLRADNGARHLVVANGPSLGSVDIEDDGQPHDHALGDDNSDRADESGVVFPEELTWGTSAEVTLRYGYSNVSGVLNAWIDFNADGDFVDPDEQIFSDVSIANHGYHDLSFSIPYDVVARTTFARFRVSSARGLLATGLAPDGEVEDYEIEINPPTDPGEVHGRLFDDKNNNGTRETHEPDLENWMVYLDANHNGQRDPTEPFDTTDAAGAYAITGLATGLRAISVEIPRNWQQTRYGGLTYTESFVAGQDGVYGLQKARAVAASPDGRHVYAAPARDSGIPYFERSAATGQLRYLGLVTEGVPQDPSFFVTGLRDITVSPDGKHVYMVSQGFSDLIVYARDSFTGQLSHVETIENGVGGTTGLNGAYSVRVSPDGAHVYAAGSYDDAVCVFARDTVTGGLTFIESHTDEVGGVTGLDHTEAVRISPDGKFVYAVGRGDNAVVVFRRELTTGRLTLVEELHGGGPDELPLRDPRRAAISPDGNHLYVTNYFGDSVTWFTRDVVTGELSFEGVVEDGVGGVDGLYGTYWVAVSPDGAHVYVAGRFEGAVAVFARDATGELSFLESYHGADGLADLHGVRSVIVSPDGKSLYAVSDTQNALAVFRRDVRGTRWVTVDSGQVVQDIDFGYKQVDTFIVTGVSPTASGFVAGLRTAPDASVLNLYDDQAGTFGPADVALTGESVGNVPGSLVVDGNTIRFIATGGPLAPDNYTLTLRSGVDGIKDLATGDPLDGNGDGTPGGDYVATFTVGPAPPVIVSMPDIARGPGQPVDIPADGDGLPLLLASNHAGPGIKSVSVAISYDPALLNIAGASPGPNAPADAIVSADTGTPGLVVLSLSCPTTPLPIGTLHIFNVTASVPESAPYGASHIIDLRDASVIDNDNSPVASTADDAIHAVTFIGDATGDGTYSGFDAQRVARITVELDGGFAAYPAIDPVIVADVTGNGDLSGLDAQRIARKAIGLDPVEIPPLPGAGQPQRQVEDATLKKTSGVFETPESRRLPKSDLLTAPLPVGPSRQVLHEKQKPGVSTWPFSDGGYSGNNNQLAWLLSSHVLTVDIPISGEFSHKELAPTGRAAGRVDLLAAVMFKLGDDDEANELWDATRELLESESDSFDLPQNLIAAAIDAVFGNAR